jgi:hypothetical protein
MTKLANLDACFVRIAEMNANGTAKLIRTEDVSFAEAQGVMFLCPKCFAQNAGPVGTHSIICWSRSRGVPDTVSPKPGRWTMAGTGLHDLTLNGDPPGRARSVLLTGDGCKWHGHVTNGDAA